MSKAVMLTGASGLLGTWLRRTAPPDVTLTSLTHRTRVTDTTEVGADLLDRRATTEAVSTSKPDVIIHAAYASNEASIITATQNLVEAAGATDAEIVYVSTDAVFSGDGRPRDEESPPNPVWDYGAWKAEAERLVMEASDRSAVVRLPLILSRDPPDGAVARIRAGAAAGQPSTWYVDEYRQPANALDVATGLWAIASLDADERRGYWHLPGPESLSRYDIARRTVAQLGLGDEVIKASPAPEAPRRPRHLYLLSDRARAAIGWAPLFI